MDDAYTPYERGLAKFRQKLGKEHPKYLSLSNFASQLLENIRLTRNDGDSQERRTDRRRILHQLQCLALTTLEDDFNHLCEINPALRESRPEKIEHVQQSKEGLNSKITHNLQLLERLTKRVVEWLIWVVEGFDNLHPLDEWS